MSDWIEGGALSHNRALLERLTGTDPHRWFAADRVEGLQFDWWEVDFGEPEGARLGAVDVRFRLDPEVRNWPFSEAIAAIASAWPAVPMTVAAKGALQRWQPSVLCLPRMDPDRFDEAEIGEYGDAAQRLGGISTVFNGPEVVAGTDSFDAVASGMDVAGRERIAVGVQASPLHREDCLGEMDWEFLAGLNDLVWLARSSDRVAALCAALGAMADAYCPLGAGSPAVASRATHTLGVEVSAVELTVEWFTQRFDHPNGAAPWWCEWCEHPHRPPALYVVGGGPEGTVCCADHFAAAARREIEPVAGGC